MSLERGGLPCPCGKSSDAYASYADGSGYCFRGDCAKYFPPPRDREDDLDEGTYTFDYHPHRGLNKRTLEKFGVKTKFQEGKPIETAFFYPNGSIKIRNLSEKKFHTKGEFKAAHLFGKNIYDKGSKRIITITEGEYDALAVAQMIGEETAAVSIRSGSQAKTDCVAEHEYINSFEKIIINFDSDEVGQDAARKVASLFDYKKVFNLCLDLHKDANGYLEADQVKEYCEAWKRVKRYTPDNILSSYKDFEGALKRKREERLGTYPFEELQGMLHGLHAGEVIVVKGDEGIGKTEIFRAIENHILESTKHPIAILHLEEDNGTTLRAMASYYAQDGSLHPESNVSDQDVLESIKKATGGDETRVFLHSSFDVEDESQFTDNMRFLVAGCGVRIVFFDHISWLATGNAGEDERMKLDRISQKLKLLAKELNFCLLMISHVNDDGKTRGSRNITKVANTVIHLQRDKTHVDPVEKNKMNMIVEKARLAGAKTGPAGYALYDDEKLMLIDPRSRGLEVPK